VRDLDCLAYLVSVRLKSRLIETSVDAVGIVAASGGGRLLSGIEGVFGARAAVGTAASTTAEFTAVTNPNKLAHVFGRTSHNLGTLIEEFGGQRGAFFAVQRAIDKRVATSGVTGLFEEVVRVGGHTVTVRGRVIDGTAHIGTFFIP
jgi:hypothetical protein